MSEYLLLADAACNPLILLPTVPCAIEAFPVILKELCCSRSVIAHCSDWINRKILLGLNQSLK